MNLTFDDVMGDTPTLVGSFLAKMVVLCGGGNPAGFTGSALPRFGSVLEDDSIVQGYVLTKRRYTDSETLSIGMLFARPLRKAEGVLLGGQRHAYTDRRDPTHRTKPVLEAKRLFGSLYKKHDPELVKAATEGLVAMGEDQGLLVVTKDFFILNQYGPLDSILSYRVYQGLTGEHGVRLRPKSIPTDLTSSLPA